ncbi:hypothetical protein [Cytobacillus firmus]|uniref:Phage protein n=1 Tax=Cytobacillus firmus TaxID=1399 RepID=A0AA46PEV4_CYTFI|nr:hypothetical protein [Cytobacillus firmus]UYG93193.1 hypothetical protein OD459_12935 [Cytobacillus firmus]
MKSVPFAAYRKPLNYEGLLKLDLQKFAGDPPPADPPGGNGNPGDPLPADPPPQDPPKTFTQEELNGIAAKEAKKAQEKLLKQLGIEDFENAKEGMKKFQEWQEGQKTEAQKQQEQLQNLETNFKTVSEENTSLKAQVSAMKAGVNAESLEDVVTLAKTMVSDEVSMDDAIAKVVEKYPHFKGEVQQEQQGQNPKFTLGGHNKQPQTEVEKWMNAFK